MTSSIQILTGSPRCLRRLPLREGCAEPERRTLHSPTRLSGRLWTTWVIVAIAPRTASCRAIVTGGSIRSRQASCQSNDRNAWAEVASVLLGPVRRGRWPNRNTRAHGRQSACVRPWWRVSEHLPSTQRALLGRGWSSRRTLARRNRVSPRRVEPGHRIRAELGQGADGGSGRAASLLRANWLCKQVRPLHPFRIRLGQPPCSNGMRRDVLTRVPSADEVRNQPRSVGRVSLSGSTRLAFMPSSCPWCDRPLVPEHHGRGAG